MKIGKQHISGLFVIAIASVGIGGCTVVSEVLAINKSADQFLSYAGDPRVKYEPGAEAQARIVARALPAAIHTVEQAQYRRFSAPVNVYVCASLDNFKAYGAPSGREGGFVLNGRTFISPKPENTAERLPGVVTHELSHLHLEQQVGLLGSARLPSWFKEGLAVSTAEGAGAESVTEDQARDAIRQGKYFRPETRNSLLFPKGAHAYGLEPHVFYREAGMFIAYLRRLDESRFRAFLLQTENGGRFAAAFRSAYGTEIDTVWQRFIAETMKSNHAPRPDAQKAATG